MSKTDREHFTAKEILILIVGATMSLAFLTIVVGIIYALVFVTQPIEAQSPNDAAFIDKIIAPIMLLLLGGLSGVLAANGLSSQKKNQQNQDQPPNP